jgi:hypothetical protein
VKSLYEDELSHKNIERKLQINSTVIESAEYRRLFDKATLNPAVNKTLYKLAKEILYDRSGTAYESMRWIDGDTGKIIAAFDDMGKIPELIGDEHKYKVTI